MSMKFQKILLTLAMLNALIAANPFASETANPPTLTLGLRGLYDQVLHGSTTTVPITYSGPTLKFSSFNLRFAYNDRALLLSGVEWGRMIPNVPTAPVYYQVESLDSTLLDNMNATAHLMAFSELGDTNIPVNEMIQINDGDTLATLELQVSNDRSLICMLHSLSWLWTRCGDNQIVTQSGTLSIRSVTDLQINKWRRTLIRTNITDFPTDLPSLTGTTTGCAGGNSTSAETLRTLSFVNGGFWMECRELFTRGDINLNGISNEYNDITVLAQYITRGQSAFTIDTAAQSFMSDFNADGVAGDLRDFVLLLREIAGEGKANLYAPDLSYTDTVTVRLDEFSLTTNRELAALLVVFDGPTKVTALDENLQITDGQINGDTYVLVYGRFTDRDSLPLIAPGAILESKGILKLVGAANYDGYKLHTIITH